MPREGIPQGDSSEAKNDQESLENISEASLVPSESPAHEDVKHESPEELRQRIEGVRSTLNESDTGSVTPEASIASDKLLSALDSAYYALLTQPYSIESQRYWKQQVENAQSQLAQNAGDEVARAEFKKVKDKYSPKYGNEPKIHYTSSWDRIKDKVVTAYKDRFER